MRVKTLYVVDDFCKAREAYMRLNDGEDYYSSMSCPYDQEQGWKRVIGRVEGESKPFVINYVTFLRFNREFYKIDRVVNWLKLNPNCNPNLEIGVH